jgi:hypothetical protein
MSNFRSQYQALFLNWPETCSTPVLSITGHYRHPMVCLKPRTDAEEILLSLGRTIYRVFCAKSEDSYRSPGACGSCPLLYFFSIALMGMMWTALYLFSLSFFWPSIFAICYYPNGDLAVNDVPCSSSGGNSTCCGFGYTCLSNKICKRSNFVNGNDTDTYVRGSCTDKTFASSSCPSFCLGKTDLTSHARDNKKPIQKGRLTTLTRELRWWQ